MRDIVPAATYPLLTTPEYGSREVLVATILPMGWAAWHRRDGSVLLGLQVTSSTADVSADLGGSLKAALDAEPGVPIEGVPHGPDRPRLADLIASSPAKAPTVHDTFSYWLLDDDADTAELGGAVEEASKSIVPTDRLDSVEAAWWCRYGNKEHIRWVLPDDEEKVLDALARLHAASQLPFADGARFLGAFRTHGLVVPVWELPSGLSAEQCEDPAEAWHERYAEALAATEPLTPEQRRARAGVVSRQLTI